MDVKFQREEFGHMRLDPDQIESYIDYRAQIPKPPGEDAHLRHILRFYIARAFLKTGADEVYILPEITVGEQTFTVDVIGFGGDKTLVAITEPDSVTSETENILELLKDLDGAEIFIVYSTYGDPGSVPEAFKEQIDAKQFRLMAVVPPPFDDVYEYDIWMFETTFRELYAEE